MAAPNPIMTALAPSARAGGNKPAAPTPAPAPAPKKSTATFVPTAPSAPARPPVIRPDKQAALLSELSDMAVEVGEVTVGNALASAARGRLGSKIEVMGVDLRLAGGLLAGLGGGYLMVRRSGAGRHLVRLGSGVLQSYVAETASRLGAKMGTSSAPAPAAAPVQGEVAGPVTQVQFPAPIRTHVREALAPPPAAPAPQAELDAERVAGPARRRIIAHVTPPWDEDLEVGRGGERLRRRAHDDEDGRRRGHVLRERSTDEAEEPSGRRGRVFRDRHEQAPRLRPILPLRGQRTDDAGGSYEG